MYIHICTQYIYVPVSIALNTAGAKIAVHSRSHTNVPTIVLNTKPMT